MRRVLAAAALGVALGAAALGACAEPGPGAAEPPGEVLAPASPPPPAPAAPAPPPAGETLVRVAIRPARGAGPPLPLLLRVHGAWRLEDPSATRILRIGEDLGTHLAGEPGQGWWIDGLVREDEVVLVPAAGQGFDFEVPRDPRPDAGTAARWIHYPGRLHIGKAENGAMSLSMEAPLDDYLVGVLAGELGANAPAEALRAQAILARSFALAHLADLTDDPKVSQAFPGMPGPALEKPLRAAVVATRDLRLVDAAGKALPGYWYHSTCGGRTASAALVFPVPPTPAYAGVACASCTSSKYFRWTADVPEEAIRKALGFGSPVAGLEVASRSPDGRALTLRGETAAGTAKEVPAVRVRTALGVNVVRSTLLDSIEGLPAGRPRPASFRFEGRGWGHGVGMCQVGACTQAAGGKTAEEILAFYYPGTRVVPVAQSPR